MFKSEALNKILAAELAAGNQIVEETNWLPTCHILVILKDAFQQSYELEEIKFSKVNDPHYWSAEYSSLDDEECLACQ